MADALMTTPIDMYQAGFKMGYRDGFDDYLSGDVTTIDDATIRRLPAFGLAGREKLKFVRLSECYEFDGAITFKECPNLQEVHLPNCQSSNTKGCFLNDVSLEFVDFGMVACIEDDAFKNCESLQTVLLDDPGGGEIVQVSSTAFNGQGVLIYVPDSQLSAYQANRTWTFLINQGKVVIKPRSEWRGGGTNG